MKKPPAFVFGGFFLFENLRGRDAEWAKASVKLLLPTEGESFIPDQVKSPAFAGLFTWFENPGLE